MARRISSAGQCIHCCYDPGPEVDEASTLRVSAALKQAAFLAVRGGPGTGKSSLFRSFGKVANYSDGEGRTLADVALSFGFTDVKSTDEFARMLRKAGRLLFLDHADHLVGSPSYQLAATDTAPGPLCKRCGAPLGGLAMALTSAPSPVGCVVRYISGSPRYEATSGVSITAAPRLPAAPTGDDDRASVSTLAADPVATQLDTVHQGVTLRARVLRGISLFTQTAREALVCLATIDGPLTWEQATAVLGPTHETQLPHLLRAGWLRSSSTDAFAYGSQKDPGPMNIPAAYLRAIRDSETIPAQWMQRLRTLLHDHQVPRGLSRANWALESLATGTSEVRTLRIAARLAMFRVALEREASEASDHARHLAALAATDKERGLAADAMVACLLRSERWTAAADLLRASGRSSEAYAVDAADRLSRAVAGPEVAIALRNLAQHCMRADTSAATELWLFLATKYADTERWRRGTAAARQCVARAELRGQPVLAAKAQLVLAQIALGAGTVESAQHHAQCAVTLLRDAVDSPTYLQALQRLLQLERAAPPRRSQEA